MSIDRAKLQSFAPAALAYADSLDSAVAYAGLTSNLRLCHFLAQVAHESGNFTAVVENLNYGAQGLANTWPSRFAIDPKAQLKVPNAKAKAIERKPEAIANVVYADRMGNGPEASGDGWKYRGRGLLQLTGRTNYTHASQALYSDARLIDNPDFMASGTGAALGAAWFWGTNSLNALADKDDVLLITKRINGGTHGLDDRKAKLAKAKTIWGVA